MTEDYRIEAPIVFDGADNPALVVVDGVAALVLPGPGNLSRGVLPVSTAFRDAWVREFGGQEAARALAAIHKATAGMVRALEKARRAECQANRPDAADTCDRCGRKAGQGCGESGPYADPKIAAALSASQETGQ